MAASDNASEKQTRDLHRILEITSLMAAEQSLDALLRVIMEGASKILDADTTSIFLCDFNTNELYSRFIQQSGIQEIRFPMDKGIAGSVVKTGHTVNIEDAYQDGRFNPEIDKQTGYRTRSILCMPLISREGQIIGVTQALNKQQGPFTPHDEKLLGLFSLQAAVSIENTLLHEEKEALFKSMIQTLSKTIDARDPVTAGHSQRVALYAARLAAESGIMDAEQTYQMDVAAFLHDIGKIGVRDDVLLKAGRLTEEEYKKIQSHAAYTSEILGQIHFSRELEEVPFLAAAHHERLDGKGYPYGLKGSALPLAARIIAIADVYDALTAYDRPYKKAMPVNQALDILKAGKGTQFDPDLVDLFIQKKCYNIERRQHRRISVSLEFEVVFPSKDDQALYLERYGAPEFTLPAAARDKEGMVPATREEEEKIRVKDISEGGMQFQTNYFFPVNEFVILRILIKDINLALVSRIIRVRNRPVGTGYIMGVEFIGLAPADRKRLISYLKSLSPDEQLSAIRFF